MIQTIVFDFGNVVGFFDHRLVTRRLAPHSDLPPEEMHRFIFSEALTDDYESGRLSTKQFLARLRDRCGLRCPDEFVEAAYADIFWPNEDICRLLPGLKLHYRLLLASNTSEMHSRQFRRQFTQVLQSFDAVVLSHDIGARKPKAAFFDHCIQLAKCKPNECVFIDDLSANVAGATDLGWHGIVYSGIENLRQEFSRVGIRLDEASRPSGSGELGWPAGAGIPS